MSTSEEFPGARGRQRPGGRCAVAAQDHQHRLADWRQGQPRAPGPQYVTHLRLAPAADRHRFFRWRARGAGSAAQGPAAGFFGGHRAGPACRPGVRRRHGRVAQQCQRPQCAPGPGGRATAKRHGAVGRHQPSYSLVEERHPGVYRRTGQRDLSALDRCVFRKRGQSLEWRCGRGFAYRHGARWRTGA